MTGAHRQLASRLGKFLVVGGTGVVVNNAALFALYQMLQVPLVTAAVLASALSIANNFVLNDRWTFNQHDQASTPRRFIRFCLVSLGGLAITTLILWGLVTYLHVQYLAANLVGIGVSTGSNFVANLHWTWTQRSEA